MIFGTSIAILSSVFPAKERGRVLGINVAAVYLGLSLGPLLGGIITSYAGWRFIYVVVAVYALLAFQLARKKIKEEWRCGQEGAFDVTGSILYAAMLFTLIYGLTLIPDRMGALLLFIAGGIMILFFRWENENANPVLKVKVFRNNVVFLFSNLAALINYSATAAGAGCCRIDSDCPAGGAGYPIPSGGKALRPDRAKDCGLYWDGVLRLRARSLRQSRASNSLREHHCWTDTHGPGICPLRLAQYQCHYEFR